MAAQIFVVSGASGSGKTTLVRGLEASDSHWQFSVSYTTRPPRLGEVDGRDYCFVTPEEFIKMIREGLLVEYVEQFGHYYGTARLWIEQALKGSRDVLFDVEIQGAKALKEHFPQGNFIFILPPSLRILEDRLRNRGSLPETEIRQRLERACLEIREADWYDYLIVNDDLADALNRLQAIVTAARCRTSNLWPEIKPQWT
jgi:guanylate kinase